MAAAHLPVSDDHPIALELASLRAAVARYQHEAHATSVKLQRHSLETSDALEHAHVLERENALLKDEAAVLRAHPQAAPHPAALQVPELTLALRRLSDKLTLTEESLLVRTNELTSARSDLAKAQFESESAYDLAARAHAQEEEAHANERELEKRARFAEEERRLADLVVQEYADLVRTLEGRKASIGSAPSSLVASGKNDSSTTLVDSLAEGKSGLKKLLDEFSGETLRLEAEISGLHAETTILSSDLDTERARAEHDRTQLAQLQLELDKYRIDDNTAAKMVSRYMKFSQSSTDSLQKAMESLKTRHDATLGALNSEIEQLHKTLLTERQQSEKLRSALDELSEDISREAFGRRREISLRLAFLGREEGLAEGLRRWIRKARESFDRAASSDYDPSALRGVFDKMVADAEALLDSLNGQPFFDENSPGSVARIIAAQDAVSTLTRELQAETDRRLEAERKLADLYVHDNPLTLARRSSTASNFPTLPNGYSSRTPAQQNQDATLHLSEAQSRSAPTPPPKSSRVRYYHHPAPSTVTSTDPTPHEPEIIVSRPEPHTGPLETESGPGTITPNADVLVATTEVSTVNDATIPIGGVEIEPSTPAQTTELPIADSAVAPMVTVPLRSDSLKRQEPILSQVSSNEDSIVHVFSQLSSNGLNTPTLTLTAQLLQGDWPSTSSSPLTQLAKVKHRYDDMQRAFRDCHLALKELKKDLSTVPRSSDMTMVIKRAVERLDDFNEDVRVELEIRITDEARIASGYETLLSVPGAISDEVDAPALEGEMLAFVDGTDRAVAKATQQFARKLDDLQHDIASIKRTLYELASAAEEPHAASAGSPKAAWTSWPASLLAPTRSASPAPTFGSVMTSPRLRHASSFSHLRPGEDAAGSSDPFASLGLRIPMPAYAPLSAGPPRATPRPRATSTMYMLGLGSRSHSFGLGSTPVKSSPMSKLATDRRDSTDTEDDAELDSDVE
ncbi:hypothetical protein B0H21DRAFT_803077 [Amylocystis lapponica]|nr:hypothetical protein B0H21DRAFT_803077 [Amylocystis lapponica]